MKIKFLFLLAVTLLSQIPLATASHIRAGDIQVSRVDAGNPSSLLYRITVNIYRDVQGVPAGIGTINFGDGSDPQQVPAVSLGFIDKGQTEVLEYVAEHSFPLAASYTISYFERNRNAGIVNMSNSSEVPFYIEAEVFINPFLGLNSSPVFSVPPIGNAIPGQRYIYNAGFIDLEGDSLSYELSTPLQEKGIEVPNYRFPNELSDSTENGQTPAVFSINESNGFIYWDAPKEPGEYNIAFKVNEWRDGIKVGSYMRDMQVLVYQCSEDCSAPVFDTLTFVRAAVAIGDTLTYTINASNNSQTVSLNAYSIHLNKENVDFSISGATSKQGRLTWNTKPEEVRESSYNFYFFAQKENTNGNPNVFSMSLLQVYLRNSKPLNLQAIANDSEKSVALSWSAYQNDDLVSYSLWRRTKKIDSVSENDNVDITWLDEYVKIIDLDKDVTTYKDENLIGTSEYI